jgi:hypothetical protein
MLLLMLKLIKTVMTLMVKMTRNITIMHDESDKSESKAFKMKIVV